MSIFCPVIPVMNLETFCKHVLVFTEKPGLSPSIASVWHWCELPPFPRFTQKIHYAAALRRDQTGAPLLTVFRHKTYMCLTTNSPSLIGRKVGVCGERGTMLEEESMREMDFMDIVVTSLSDQTILRNHSRQRNGPVLMLKIGEVMSVSWHF